MRARINNDGVLEFARDGVWVKQLCIRGKKFVEEKVYCAVDCPLIGVPISVPAVEGNEA